MRTGVAILVLAACGGADGNDGHPGLPDAGATATDAAPDASLSDAGPPPLTRLLYLADQEQDGLAELYLAAFTDRLESVVKVNSDTGGRSVRSFEWSPTGDHLFYGVESATQAGGSESELYVVPVAGVELGEPVAVAVELATTGDQVIGTISGARWSPDGARIAFVADRVSSVYQLFTVEVGHEDAPVQLPGLERPDFDVLDYAWSPDGSMVAYRVTYVPGPDEEDRHGLWLAPAAGGAVAEVSDLPPPGEVSELSFWEVGYGWSPDGSHLFYRADQDIDNRTDLYVTEVVAGVPLPAVRVSGALDLSGREVVEAQWSPDASRLVFVTDPGYDRARRLYLVDLTGGEPGPAVVASEAIGAQQFPVWSPDSRWVAFNGLLDEGPMELFALHASGGGPVPVNPPLPIGRQVASGSPSCMPVAWSRDSAQLGYLTTNRSGLRGELWTTDFSSGTPAAAHRLNGALVTNGSVACPFRWSSTEPTALYAADQETRTQIELFTVDAATPGDSAKVNGVLVLDGDVQDAYLQQLDFAWSPGGDWIAYRADQEVNERIELYAVRRETPGQSVRVSSVVELGDVAELAWAP